MDDKLKILNTKNKNALIQNELKQEQDYTNTL